MREERDSLEYLVTRSHSVVLYETAGKIQLPILDTADVPEQIFYLHNLCLFILQSRPLAPDCQSLAGLEAGVDGTAPVVGASHRALEQ